MVCKTHAMLFIARATLYPHQYTYPHQYVPYPEGYELIDCAMLLAFYPIDCYPLPDGASRRPEYVLNDNFYRAEICKIRAIKFKKFSI